MLLRVLDTASYSLNPFALPLPIISIVFLILFTRALVREGYRMVSVTLFLLGVAIVLWFSSFFFMYCSTDEDVALWWAKASYLGIPFIPSALYHFTVSVLRIYDRYRARVWTGWALSAFFSAVIIGTDFIIQGVYSYPWGYYPRYTWPSVVYLAFFLSYLGFSLRHFWIEQSKVAPESIQRRRSRSFVIAFGISYLGVIDYLPKFGIPVYPLGFLALLAAVLIILRTVSRYRLVDITPTFAAKSIIDTMNDSLFVLDAEGSVRLVNSSTLRLLGRAEPELVGKQMATIFGDAAFSRQIEDVAQTGLVQNRELAYLHPAGEALTLSLSASLMKDENGEPLAFVCIVRDITETKRAELQLRMAHDELETRVEERTAELREANERMARFEAERIKAQKLESLGILAGGIAHDFNNILTAVLGNISFARMKLGPDDPISASLEEAEKASLHARDLTRQLLTFSRGGAPVKKTLSPERLIRDSSSFALRGTNVGISFRFAEGLWPIEVDPGQIGQVFNNLVINACQAMPEGGTITISASNVTIRAGNALPLEDGRYLKITVEDQGTGIPEEHLPNIFDPYFSTKPAGSGLGLSVVYSIIKNHNGHIEVGSIPGRGTVFALYIPASHKEIVGEAAEEPKLRPGKGRILVMDDEEMVRNVAGLMLKEFGYEVALAGDGEEAVRLYKEMKAAGRGFDAIIVDLTIPGGMGGKEAIEKLIEFDPDVKAIVSSGYSDDPVMADFRKYGFKGVVSKPYRIKDLNETVHRVINGLL